MYYLLWFLTLGISYAVSVFGFCQIIGSLQTRQKMFVFTIVLWAFIIYGLYFAIKKFLPDQIYACYIGFGISLIQSLSVGKIE